MLTPSILILDDDDDLRESVADIFCALGRACLALPSVAAMIDARQAVLACHLAILDVNLGQGLPSGVDAYTWLREQHFGGRIAFLTGHAPSHPLVARASPLGERVLQKPISTGDLRALARSAGES
jgi:DNA-binding response OmpR family regulator